MDVNTRNWVDSAQDRDFWRTHFEYGIEPSVFTRHGVSWIVSNCLADHGPQWAVAPWN